MSAGELAVVAKHEGNEVMPTWLDDCVLDFDRHVVAVWSSALWQYNLAEATFNVVSAITSGRDLAPSVSAHFV